MEAHLISLPTRSAAPYIVVVLATELVVRAVGTLALNGPWVQTIPLDMAIYLAGMAAALACWISYRAFDTTTGTFRVFLALVFGLWLYAVIGRVAQGVTVPPDAFTVAYLVALIWTKPPKPGDGRLVLDGLAWAFIVVCSGALALEVSGLMFSWHGQVPGLSAFTAWERSAYWIPLADPLGLAGRWGGPFPHPNQVGPVGTYLIVVAMCRRGIRAWVFLACGFLILVLSASRTSTLAALAASIVVISMMVWRRHIRPLATRGWSVVVAPVGLVALLVTNVVHAAQHSSGLSELVGSAESLTGRTEVWSTYWALWQNSPLLGVPERTIADAVRDLVIPAWAAHSAHNLALDYLARSGIVGLLLLVACLAALGVLAFGAARGGEPTSLGILAAVVTTGVTEALVYWDVMAATTMILLAAAAAAVGTEGPTDPKSSARWWSIGKRQRSDEARSGSELGCKETV